MAQESVRAEYEVIEKRVSSAIQAIRTLLKAVGQRFFTWEFAHVSSLIEWNKVKRTPPLKPFPICMDTLLQINSLMNIMP